MSAAVITSLTVFQGRFRPAFWESPVAIERPDASSPDQASGRFSGRISAAAIAGVRRWPLLLALGWTGHIAWDLVLHHAGGPAFAPSWYPPLCVGFDLFLGGYIAGAVAKAAEDRAPFPRPGL